MKKYKIKESERAAFIYGCNLHKADSIFRQRKTITVYDRDEIDNALMRRCGFQCGLGGLIEMGELCDPRITVFNAGYDGAHTESYYITVDRNNWMYLFVYCTDIFDEDGEYADQIIHGYSILI